MAASQQPSFDPGLTQQYSGSLLRSINKDGSFNVVRKGYSNWGGSIYHRLVTIPWPQFLGWVAAAYIAVNCFFAVLYLALGPGALHAAAADLGLGPFGQCFFFSVHTLTTVGYGALYPSSVGANFLRKIGAEFPGQPLPQNLITLESRFQMCPASPVTASASPHASSKTVWSNPKNL